MVRSVFKIYSHKVLKEANKLDAAEIDHSKFSSGLMFPTLEEMFAQLNPKLGFDVEIKYPLDLEVRKALVQSVDQHLIQSRVP